jgi:hypothetical protein
MILSMMMYDIVSVCMYRRQYRCIFVPKTVNIKMIASYLWPTVEKSVLLLDASKCVDLAMWAANEILVMIGCNSVAVLKGHCSGLSGMFSSSHQHML